MEFTCPHCGKTFEQKTRNVSTSAKANAARKRNGALGGGQYKVSPVVIEEVYATRDNWTWQDFKAALEKKSGETYSRTQAFTLLRLLRKKGELVDKAKTLITEIEESRGKHSAFIGYADGRTEPQESSPVGKKKTAKK